MVCSDLSERIWSKVVMELKGDDLQTYNRAVRLAKLGHKSNAYILFSRLRRNYPQEVELWGWLVLTTPHLVEAREFYQLLSYTQPNHHLLGQIRAYLKQEAPGILEEVAKAISGFVLPESNDAGAAGAGNWPAPPQLDLTGATSLDQPAPVNLTETSLSAQQKEVDLARFQTAQTLSQLPLLYAEAILSETKTLETVWWARLAGMSELVYAISFLKETV